MATSYLSPGVYIEEVDADRSPSRQSELRRRHSLRVVGRPTNEAVLITNWAQYTAPSATSRTRPCSRNAVYGFLHNGAPRPHLQRLSQDGDGGSRPPRKREEGSRRRRRAGEGGKPAAAPSASRGPLPSPALYIGKDEGPGAARA